MGHRIKCTLLDGHNITPIEVKHFRTLAGKEKAVMINGWGTGGTIALRELINEIVKVAFLSESLSSDVADPVKYPYNFVLGPTYEDQIKIGMTWAKQQGAKTIVLLHNDIEYGRGPVRNVINEKFAEKIGLKVLGTEEYAWEVTDALPHLFRIKKLNPDYVYIQDSANNTMIILKAAVRAGFPVSKIIANNWNTNPVIPRTLGEKAEGLHSIVIFSDYGSDIPLMKEITEFAKSNEILKKDRYYVRGWTEGKIIAEAITRVLKKTEGKLPVLAEFRNRIRDELEGLSEFDVGGAIPPITYKDHQGTTMARISEIRDGKFIVISDPIVLKE